jgi:hypothetical protein
LTQIIDENYRQFANFIKAGYVKNNSQIIVKLLLIVPDNFVKNGSAQTAMQFMQISSINHLILYFKIEHYHSTIVYQLKGN